MNTGYAAVCLKIAVVVVDFESSGCLLLLEVLYEA